MTVSGGVRRQFASNFVQIGAASPTRATLRNRTSFVGVCKEVGIVAMVLLVVSRIPWKFRSEPPGSSADRSPADSDPSQSGSFEQVEVTLFPLPVGESRVCESKETFGFVVFDCNLANRGSGTMGEYESISIPAFPNLTKRVQVDDDDFPTTMHFSVCMPESSPRRSASRAVAQSIAGDEFESLQAHKEGSLAEEVSHNDIY